ncbi:Lipid A 3-O-deacylase (PagL) [Salegentibacter echinorum]|uniref:Lipid A 3-O-deacylase (PagL) n=1 Tax=Salegentibacter echinorum TaxID=1073325 RepID=A0A1M5GCV7_SALEC|nr:acyloxyacyl hydrolase [Salegentibacter echinorum]SHG01526.1 Lipid A 3-O-deacylase (PagL) [Salegentibacter echinorum]
MKKLLLLLFLFSCFINFGQEKSRKYYAFDANYFYGSILEHNPDIAHLITGHPTGVILGFQQKTYGLKAWERRYNYPDFGYSFTYQDMKNKYLGENYGLYAHFNFYALNRKLMLRIGQGLAYATNPYHPDKNYINNAYGSRILSSTYLMANYYKKNIFKGFGLQAGVSVIHYSNADFKSPNNSTNTFTFNLGVNYLLEHENEPAYVPKDPKEKRYTEPIHYNFVLRGGINTTGVIGSAQYPFFTAAAFADKVINKKSTLQAGAEFFYSRALEEYIYYQSVAFPSGHTSGDEDANRVGIFVGHQLNFNKMSLITQLGFYVYYPYTEYVDQLYNRVGLRRKLTENWWTSITVRSHGANAEAVELSLGYRL